MPLVKYTSNADSRDQTRNITLRDGRKIYLGGDEVEVDGDVLTSLQESKRINVEVVGDDLEDFSRKDLDKRLEAKGLDPKDYSNKEEAADALREASSSGGAPDAGGAGGGAAGPGGAAAGPGVGGGPATTVGRP